MTKNVNCARTRSLATDFLVLNSNLDDCRCQGAFELEFELKQAFSLLSLSQTVLLDPRNLPLKFEPDRTVGRLC